MTFKSTTNGEAGFGNADSIDVRDGSDKLADEIGVVVDEKVVY